MAKMALTHDISEIWTGDIPSTLNQHEGVKEAKESKTQELYKKHGFEIEDYDQTNYGLETNMLILKIADYMEALHKCVEEKRLGNTHMEGAYNQIESKLDECLNLLESALVRIFPASLDGDLNSRIDQIKSIHRGTEVNLREESATWGA
jgi:5'-deoxynucleotidase YfbR-like HD superfamily hydrolase